jgi:hypothetical protein
VPLDKGSGDHGCPSTALSCATVFGEGHMALHQPPSPPPVLIELRSMDRETARRNMRAGLVAGGIAAGIFALSFVAAFLYIAQ